MPRPLSETEIVIVSFFLEALLGLALIFMTILESSLENLIAFDSKFITTWLVR